MSNSRRPRPSAFDVSFPEEAAARASQERASTSRSAESTATQRASSSNSVPQKRRNDAINNSRAAKQQQLPPVAYYRSERNEVIETEDLVLDGEDPDDAEEQEGRNKKKKPVRILSGFSFFDPRHKNEMVPLTAMEEVHGEDRAFEGAGFAVAKPNGVDEDEGQEDDDEDEPIYLRLGAILRYWIGYTPEDELVYIETLFAWYILDKPSKGYEAFYRPFYKPRHIARLVILSATEQHPESHESFIGNFKSTVDIFGRTYVEQDLWEAVPDIQEAIEEFRKADQSQLRSAPIVRHLLGQTSSTSKRNRHHAHQSDQRTIQPRTFIGDLDTAVLKKENLNRTTVTPSIFALAWGRVHEKLDIVGPPYHPLSKAEKENQKKEAFSRLRRLIAKAKGPNPVDWSKDERLTLDYLKSVKVGGEKYEVGDVVLVENSDAPFWNLNADVNDLSPDTTLPDLFWFARILQINQKKMEFHFQWFHHGSQTMLEELAHPQEIFLADLCGDCGFDKAVAKVNVHDGPFSNAVKKEEFFCQFMFDEGSGAFTSINRELLANMKSLSPEDNCSSCQIWQERDRIKDVAKIDTDGRCQNGVALAGKTYHIDDVVLFRAESGPAHIGYITGFEFPQRQSKTIPTMVKVKRIGRIRTLKHILPQDVLVDERHLFLTQETITFDAADLLQVVYAPSLHSLADESKLEEWLALSPDHFYMRYQFNSLNPEAWNQRKRVPDNENFLVCQTCWKERLQERKLTSQFSAYSERDPLPTLDLFGGVGAFSKGLAEGSECLNVTHAVEIGPSAAKTFQRNSPGTIVYNQCANHMLRYAIKFHEGHKPDPPMQLYDGKTPVPAPPKRGEIQLITIGFPCQTHSTLNRYKDVRDIKSNLILNALSWIDFYRPVLCYFENVAGFLLFRVFQADNSSDVEGIEMGGLKLLKRGLIDMGYQVHEGLLQAAHYGTPQRRERFFLIAALDGTPLPALPQPTHDFPKEFFKNTDSDVSYKTTPSTSLSILYPNKKRIQPIRSANGTALHPCVTIGDAISDLPRFDWTHRDEPRSRQGRQGVPGFSCNPEELARRGLKHCGYEGRPEYHHPPKTTFQRQARMKPVKNLQHFTRILKPATVKRCINIRLQPNADYRTLRADLLEWSTANPSSAMVRKGFKSGAYGRLDMNAVFPTTVTNAGPTAKQSRCLHPDSHRMLTTREFARSQGFPDSFEFVSIKDKVITIQRQIGNAVPLPVANALGRELRAALFQKWKRGKEDAIVIDDESGDDGITRRIPSSTESSDDDRMDIS